MKTIPLALVAALISSSAIGADNWYDQLTGREPTHVWEHTDGSRTYRYDTPGATKFESRSAESVSTEQQFNGMLAQIAIQAIVQGSKSLYDWWKEPKSESSPKLNPKPESTPQLNLAKESPEIIQLFGSQSTFLSTAKTELEAARLEERCYAARHNQVQVYGITMEDRLYKHDDGKVYFGELVISSDNQLIKKGDLIVECDEIFLAPGRDLTAVTNKNNLRSHKLLILRDGKFAMQTLETSVIYPTESEINIRRGNDAVATVIYRAHLSKSGVTNVAWK
jgi:hypothetical protein